MKSQNENTDITTVSHFLCRKTRFYAEALWRATVEKLSAFLANQLGKGDNGNDLPLCLKISQKSESRSHALRQNLISPQNQWNPNRYHSPIGTLGGSNLPGIALPSLAASALFLQLLLYVFGKRARTLLVLYIVHCLRLLYLKEQILGALLRLISLGQPSRWCSSSLFFVKATEKMQ